MSGPRLLVVLASMLSAIFLACSTSNPTKPGGEVCSTNSECASGACLGLSVFSADGGCSVAGTSCSSTCSTDADCTSLGTGFKCFESCNGGPKTCGAT